MREKIVLKGRTYSDTEEGMRVLKYNVDIPKSGFPFDIGIPKDIIRNALHRMNRQDLRIDMHFEFPDDKDSLAFTIIVFLREKPTGETAQTLDSNGRGILLDVAHTLEKIYLADEVLRKDGFELASDFIAIPWAHGDPQSN